MGARPEWNFGPDIETPVEAYLRRRGWKERLTTRAYMTALQGSVMSLYEVSEIRPGQSFRARDLIRGGEPILVTERADLESLADALSAFRRLGRDLDQWEPVHLARIAAVLSGCYGAGASEAALALTPRNSEAQAPSCRLTLPISDSTRRSSSAC